MPGIKNPMCNTFPRYSEVGSNNIQYDCIFRIASCDYWRWGPGGKQENINAICILGLNHIHDKVLKNFVMGHDY